MPVARPSGRGRRPRRTGARVLRTLVALALVCVTASCAYYNTFYLAKKYYMKATDGQPYEVDRDGTTQRSNYTKSSDYAKKLLGVYPKSKYVDDAWLMWARGLVGTDDPLKAVAMLQEFETRFPKSELRPDAEFFLGLAYRLARKHELAVQSFDEFLAQAPKHELVPYAYYERSKAFMSLQRYREAAESAGQILERYPRHLIADKALRQRAEARYQQHDYQGARQDFHTIGDRALTDDERLRLLLREVDCLEASHGFDEARSLLREARSHVPIPPPLPVMPRVGAGSASASANTPNQPPVSVVRTPAEEQYGRITLRMGGVELLAGHVGQAIELYRSVLQDYPRSQLSAEAQYRIGYAYETGDDDFERARAEYAKVREQTGTSQFTQQAQARLDNLDRIDRFRTAAGADSTERKAEARFLIAEHYLFNLDRPDRALEEYRAIFDSIPTPSVRARALNAEAWLLSRKLNQPERADSLFWRVVREYPSTEGQLAARDYLELEGHKVPDALIVAPTVMSKPMLDTSEPLTQPPGTTSRLGGQEPALIEPGAMEYGPGVTRPGSQPPGQNPGTPSQWRNSTVNDSLRYAMALRDSLLRVARSDTSAAGRARVDSLHRATRADTLGRGAAMATIAAGTQKPGNVVVGPESAKAPHLSGAGSASGAAATAGGGAAAATGAAGVAAAGAAGAVTYGPPAPHTSAKPTMGPHFDPATAAAGGVAVGAVAAGASADDSMPHAPGTSPDSAAHADSLHKSSPPPRHVVAAPAAVHTTPEVVKAAPPSSIVSWDQPAQPKLSKAQKDSVHAAEKLRAEAKHDSLAHVHAERDSLKKAEKAAKAKGAPAAPDSAHGGQP